MRSEEFQVLEINGFENMEFDSWLKWYHIEMLIALLEHGIQCYMGVVE